MGVPHTSQPQTRSTETWGPRLVVNREIAERSKDQDAKNDFSKPLADCFVSGGANFAANMKLDVIPRRYRYLASKSTGRQAASLSVIALP